MSDSSKFDPAQFDIIKKAIPFEAGDTAEPQGDADSEVDFSIADVDESAECESEIVEQTFLEQSALQLGNIHGSLTAWRTNGATADMLGGIGREFHALKESAASAGFDDVSQLSYVVVSLLEQGDKLVSDDSSLLNLLEEIHDGLAAELGFISRTAENHLRSLISMVQLLLADESAPPMAIPVEVSEANSDGGHGDQPQAHSSEDFNRADVEVLATQTEADATLRNDMPVSPTTSQALLVKAGAYRVALLLQNIERVMRVHESEIQLRDGQHYVSLEEQQILVINLAEHLGEACVRADAFRFLVITRSPNSPDSQDNMGADSVVAFEIDRFQEVAEIVVKAAGSRLASIGDTVGVAIVGVAVLADASVVPVLDLEQLAERTHFNPDYLDTE